MFTPPPIDSSNFAKTSDIINITNNIPTASNTTPPPAALDSSLGTITTKYSLADHTHASTIQKAVLITNTSGMVSINWIRPFPDTNYAITAIANANNVVNITYTNKTSNGVTFIAKMSQALPATLTLLTNLINYNIFANPAANVQIDVFAGKVTQ